ncbi:MAG: TlpA family protein disulfide reductase [Anaerolineales bacterium]|nr:TlpA family protein disulfide reductase [Anaerolineales bacterium]MCX7609187.1 TlpA family protein disulfide reductase [Anaerolineales bacterium]MDW8227782.1 TlpA disulfide reductase family protein [Anaerolineales bacterium]
MARTKRRKSYARWGVVSLFGAGIGLFVLALILGAILYRREHLAVSAEVSSSVEGEIFPPIQLNTPAPDLSLKDLEGNLVSLSDYRGKVVLVNHWATWCPPCRAEMPDLEAYYQKYAGKNFVLIGIEAGDSLEEVRRFVSEQQISYPIWLDTEMIALAKFRTNSLPSSFLIDSKGMMRAMWIGMVNRATLETYVTPLLSP